MANHLGSVTVVKTYCTLHRLVIFHDTPTNRRRCAATTRLQVFIISLVIERQVSQIEVKR